MDVDNYRNNYNINNENYSDNLKVNDDLNSIFSSILKESFNNKETKFNTSDLLSIFIRKNRNITNQTLKEISQFFDSNDSINPELLIQCMDSIYNSLIDKKQIINFINLNLPVMIKSLNKININAQNITTINRMYFYIGKYLNKGGIYIRELVEKNIDILLEIFNPKKPKPKDNAKLISLKLLSQILKNSPTLSFNKLVAKDCFDTFLNVTDCYKDANKDIRVANGILIYNFLQMFTGRDRETKYFYLRLLYEKINLEFTTSLKKNKEIPKDYLILSGLFITIENINLSEPLFFRDISNFTSLIKNLFKCFDSKNNNIKIEFIKFIPKLYKLNKTEFKDNYENQFLGKINNILNKDTHHDIKNALFATIGKLSYYLEDESYNFFIDKFFTLIKSLILEKKYIDDDLIKCLSDLLNNKKSAYIKQIKSINIQEFLPKLFETFFSTTKIDYLISLMKFYESNSEENITTVIISLNVVSHIICGDFFNLENFAKIYKKNIFNEGLQQTLLEIRENIFKSYKDDIYRKKTLSENFKLKINNLQIILNALTLFSLIPNNLFFKDMFIFFNDKLLPLLEFAPIKIYKKIIDLLEKDFIKIYPDDINLSDYIFHNIIESIFTTSLNEQNIKIQNYSFKMISKKEKLVEYCFKDKNLDILKIFGFYSAINEIITQERIIKTMSEIALKDSDKNFYYVFVKKAIYSITFKFYYLDDLIQKENISYTLYYISKYFMNFFYPSIPVHLIDIANYLILTTDLRSILMINIFKTLIEIFKSNLVKDVNDNVIFKENCDLIFILSFDIMKMESMYEAKYDILLELIYLIIKNQNIDIFNVEKIKKRIEKSSFFTLKQERGQNKNLKDYFNDEKIITKLNSILDKINNKTIIEILYRNILNVENENCILNALKIFGLCGAIDPNKIENIFEENNTIKYLLEVENNYREIDEKAIQIITFNNKLNQYEEIDTSSLSDPTNMKVVLLGLEILKLNKQDDLSEKIIRSLISLIKFISKEDYILIDIIIPTIIQIFPKFQIERQNLLLECIRILLNKFEDKMKKYSDDIIPFIINYIEKDYLEKISKIISIFDEKYKKEFENYYSIIIEKYLSLINSDSKNYFIYDNIFMLLIKHNQIKPYLKLLYEALINKLFEQTDPVYINKLLNIIEQISKNKNCEILYSSIINNILNKLELILNKVSCDTEFKFDQKKLLDYFLKTSSQSENNKLIIQHMLNIFKNISDNSRTKFIYFLSVIYNTFSSFGLLNHPICRKKLKSLIINKCDYTFMTNKELIDEIFYSNQCKGNCIFGFHCSVKGKQKYEEKSKTFKKTESMKEVNCKDNVDSILQSFDNSYCTLEEDWDDWLKSCIKKVLEESPSPYLSEFSVITDYYLSIASELSSHGFYSYYINCNNETKKKITEYLKVALSAPKASDTVMLSILNLIDNMERKRVNMELNDYEFYGNICFKLKAYAKSLYYFEKSFNEKKNVDIFEKLIYLYNQLGIPEWGYGTIKLIEKAESKNDSEFQDFHNYENKFIWYMNLGKNRKALEMIEEKLKTEKNEDKKSFLKKKRNFCKNELFNWEEMFLEEENDQNLNDSFDSHENKKIDKYDKINELIEEEIFSARICTSLDKWEHLNTHIFNVNKKIKENFELEELGGLTTDEFDISDMYSGRNSREKNTSFHQSDRKYITEYISYNDLILKNIYLFNKIDKERIYDLNLLSSMINIMEGNYDVAKKYKEDAKEINLYNLKPLLKESHIRGYALLINNQQISYLEDIIEYKENHDGDLNYLKDMKKIWDKSYSQINFEPLFSRKLLFLYRFVFPEKDIISTKISFGNILRKYKLYEQSKTIFMFIKNSINKAINEEKDEKELLSLEEQRLKLELSYNKCIFKNGEINEAIKQSRNLVNLLNDEKMSQTYKNISNKLKGRIYGDYAVYIKKKYFNINEKNQSKELKEKDQQYFIEKSNRYLSPKLIHRNYFLTSNSYLNNRLKEKAAPKNSFQIDKNEVLSDSEDISLLNKKYNEFFISKSFHVHNQKIKNINTYLSLATKYYDRSHKYWYYFSNLNYEAYRYLYHKRISIKEKGVNYKYILLSKKYEISYANNAINGIKKCLSLLGNNINKGYQNCIKLIDIFFNLGGEDDELLNSIFTIINELNSIIFALLLPILISRIGINNKKILEKLIQILVKLCLDFPTWSLIPILIYNHSNSSKKKSIAKKILDLVEKENPKLKHVIENYEIFIKELNKCSLLLHEKWYRGIFEASKFLIDKNYNGLINELEPLHKLMSKNPDNLYEIHFNQLFYDLLFEAHNYLKKYIKYSNQAYIKFAWERYQVVYNEIKNQYKAMPTISLQYVSPLLSSIPENQIGLPGYYFLNKLNKGRKQLIIGKMKENYSLENLEQPVYIKRIDKYLYVFNTKQKPRKISLIGTDDKEYKYLLKSNEDLRQDERITQVFNFVNSIISLDKEISSKNLLITVYPVIPLSNMTGLIGFLPNCETIGQLISEARKDYNIPQNLEYAHLGKNYPKYGSSSFITKLEAFEELNNLSDGLELAKIIWTKSLNCESWLIRRTNYVQSLAVMSVVGYILGLGDRHTNNLMMDRQNGKIIHIDYGDCFEIAMFRRKFPEKIPFRLTKMFVKALGISGVEGAFRIFSEKIMKLLRKNKDSLYTILNSLVYDPLVTFKLMLPLMKNNTNTTNANNTNNKKDVSDLNNLDSLRNIPQSDMHLNVFMHSSSVMDKYSIETIAKYMALTKKEEDQKSDLYNLESELKEENDEIDMEKNEKMAISNVERKLLNYYEESGEIEFEDLNKVAQKVLKRITEKLSGTDFNNSKPLEIGEQIDRLIDQAMDEENLCQLYLGWAPYW